MEDLAELLLRHDWVDLTHTLEEGIPVWPTHPRFAHTLYESQEYGDVATHYGLSIEEHTGTHMDAPLHFISEGTASHGTDEIPLDRLAGRAAVVDATGMEPENLLAVDHIEEWEKENGSIKRGDQVLIRYGWDVKWATGKEGRGFLDGWPGLSGEVAEYLAEKGVSLVGCDTLAIDVFGSEENPAHYALLGNEIYIVENQSRISTTWEPCRRTFCSWLSRSRSVAVRDLLCERSRSCLAASHY